jgi:hypothetical protein
LTAILDRETTETVIFTLTISKPKGSYFQAMLCGTCLHSQLLRRLRQEDYLSPGVWQQTLSQKQETREKFIVIFNN